MPLVFGYCRVSSDEQAAHGISIEAQRQILNGYAAMAQSEIQIFEDAGYSGKNTNRPALQRLLALIPSGGVSTVVVWKLDRLSRSLRDTLTMIEDTFTPYNVSLVSVTESINTSTPSGRMMLNILASFAQLEREQDSDRVVMAHKHLAWDCKYLGGHIPLGYAVDETKHYRLDPVTAPIARRVFDMYLTRAGYTRIMDYLNAPDIFPLTTKTRPYTKQDLNAMIKNECYAGVYVRRMGADKRHRITSPETIRVPGGVPALLTAEEWDRVNAIREENGAQHRAPAFSTSVVYPLSGIVYCAVCGRLMRVRHGGKARSGERERYYSCATHCVKSARVEKVEDAVYATLMDMAANPEAVKAACEVANTYAAGRDADNSQEISELSTRVTKINGQIARIVAFVKDHGADAPASMMAELKDLEKQKSALEAAAERASRPSVRYDTGGLLTALEAAKDIKKLPPEERKRIVQTAVYRVIVSDESFTIRLGCFTSSGDEPRPYTWHNANEDFYIQRVIVRDIRGSVPR